MNVFFGATSRGISERKDDYRLIRKTLISLNCVINFDWLENAIHKVEKDPKGKRNMTKNIKMITNAIKTSDFVVVEYTIPNFSSSHQILYALQRKKPVLVLRKEKDNSFADTYLENLDDTLLEVYDYKDETVEDIIRKFIRFQSLDKNHKRYNIVLESKHKYYLDWASDNKNRSRSEIVRIALNRSIEEDTEFKKYIK